MAKRPAKRAKRKTPIGCLVWLALMLAIAVAFFATRASIAKAIDAVGLKRATSADQPAQEPPSTTTPQPDPPASDPAASPRTSPAPTRSEPEAPSTPQTATPDRRAPVTPESRAQTRRSTLYLARVGNDGSVAIEGVRRVVTFTDAPLTSTLDALIAGPTPAESASGLRSLIPSETRLLEVRVEGRTALISLNESFRFSPYGRDGLEAQLKQIVYTATEFDTVDRVQILIGGKATDYLGPEGIRIREPLTRESFSDGSI